MSGQPSTVFVVIRPETGALQGWHESQGLIDRGRRDGPAAFFGTEREARTACTITKTMCPDDGRAFAVRRCARVRIVTTKETR